MIRVLAACLAGWGLLVLLHLAAPAGLPHTWGWDALKYLPRHSAFLALTSMLLWTPLLSARLGQRILFLARMKPWHAGLLALFVLPLLRVSTPLLGDGLDRIEALSAGLEALHSQPAPLDIALHLALFKLFSLAFPQPAWETGFLAYRVLSYLAGAVATGASWAIAKRWSDQGQERALIFFGLMLMGTLVMFCGYPENYGLLAAGLLVHLLLLDHVTTGERKPWTLGLSLAVLCALHYFAILVLPATLWALYKSGHFQPRPMAVAFIGLVTIAFLAFVLGLVQKHYRGVGSIFITPGTLLSPGHLLDYLSALLLVSPAAPLLVLALFVSKTGSAPRGYSPTESYLAAGSLTFLLFFFVLRPVLGAAADWDLFSLPAFFFTPYLLLRVVVIFSRTRVIVQIAALTLSLSLFHTGPWVALNAREQPSLARFSTLLDQEAGRNTWAASYGFLKLGRYYRLTSRPDQAMLFLNRALEVNPDSATLRQQVAQQLLSLGQKEKAMDQFALSRLLSARHQAGQGNYPAAEKLYREYLSRFPQDEQVREELHKMLLRK